MPSSRQGILIGPRAPGQTLTPLELARARGLVGVWLVAGTRVNEPYPCWCLRGMCSQLCRCNGRRDHAGTPPWCCGRALRSSRPRAERTIAAHAYAADTGGHGCTACPLPHHHEIHAPRPPRPSLPAWDEEDVASER